MNIQPLSPPTTNYNQIGPLTFGSNGSHAYRTGTDNDDGRTIERQPNGELVPNVVYAVGPDGQLRRCKRYTPENMFCD